VARHVHFHGQDDEFHLSRIHTVSVPHSPSSHQPSKKRARRLRPEVAAAIIERQRAAQLDDLYSKPVDALEPEEIARMKAAFFRS
jgi:hypothetical protein